MSAADDERSALPGIFRSLFSRRKAVVSGAPNPDAVAAVRIAPPANAPAPAAAVMEESRPPTAPASRRPPRDPRRILVVGASGRLGREVVRALRESATRYSVIGVARALSDAPEGCTQVVTLDVATQTPLLAEEAIRLGCGAVVWCASAGPGGRAKPRDVDFAAVRDLARALGCGGRVPGAGGDAQQWLADGDDVISLVDFSTADGRAAFQPLNDVIMGGRSSSRVRGGEADADDGAPAVWSGTVVGRGGGFASVRAPLPRDGANPGVDLSSCAGVALTCRADGKTYKVNLRNDQEPELVFQAAFDTAGAGEWQTVRVPFSAFLPVKRGRIAYADNDAQGAVYAAQLDTCSITSVGLVCSKFEISHGGSEDPRFREGPFRMDLARLDAYRDTTPRFVLASSAAVTRPWWSVEKKSLYRQAADIPIVNLNGQIGNLLGAKLAGEDALRASQIPYTVIRPTALVAEMPAGGGIQYTQGDVATGRIAPADLAQCIVHALQTEDASWKTFEVNGDPNRVWSADAASSALRGLPLDSEQVLYPMSAADV